MNHKFIPLTSFCEVGLLLSSISLFSSVLEQVQDLYSGSVYIAFSQE